MLDKFKNKSVIASWIYFFVGLIVFITVVFSLFSYSSKKKMKELLLQNAQYAFNVALDSVQYRLSSMMNQYLQLSSSDDLTAIMSKGDIDYFRDDNATTFLDEVVAQNKIDSATISFVYFKDRGVVFSKNGVFSAERFFDDHFSSQMSFEYWKNLHNSNEFVPHEVVYKSEEKNAAVMICIPVYKSRTSLKTEDYDVVITYILDKDRFFALNKNISWLSATELYLLEENGDILFRSANAAPAEVLNINEVMLSRKDEFYASEYFYHNSKKMRFYFEVPFDKLYPEERMWNIYVALCFLVLITGVLGAMKMFINMHYGKIDNLIKMFSDHNKGNEWEILDNNLRRILEENKSFIESRREIERKLKNTVLRQALYVSDDAENVRNYFRENKIELDADLIMVTLFGAEDMEKTVTSKRLCSELSDILGNDNIVTLKNGIVAVLSGVQESNRNTLESNMHNASQRICEKFNIQVGCFCSKPYFISDIPAAYRDALQKMEKVDSQLHKGGNENGISGIFYTMEDKIKIFENLSVGNKEAVKEILENVFYELKNGQYSSRVISIFASDMVSLILDITQRKNIELLQNTSAFDFNKAYIFGDNISEMQDNLVKTVEEISDEILNNEKSSQRQLCEKMFEYIAQNYRDPNISLKSLADKFHISPSYVSMNFSKFYGASPSYFINKYRLEEATELLANPALSVEKIAGMIGYSHERTFSRNFKKFKGIYPYEYRKLQ